jgi:hypothetical protein
MRELLHGPLPHWLATGSHPSLCLLLRAYRDAIESDRLAPPARTKKLRAIAEHAAGARTRDSEWLAEAIRRIEVPA